jgi:hypothetical protein
MVEDTGGYTFIMDNELAGSIAPVVIDHNAWGLSIRSAAFSGGGCGSCSSC